MSGGHFGYSQYHIANIIEEIEDLINSNEDETKDQWGDTIGNFYPDDIISEFKTAIKYLKLAHIYTQRIDWLVSGDDREDSFRRKLKKELENV